MERDLGRQPPAGVMATVVPWMARRMRPNKALCRWLAGSGQKAAALWLSRGEDAVVLSELGLHLSAVERMEVEDASPREALARVRSLSAVDAPGPALEAGRLACERWPERATALLLPLLGLHDLGPVLPWLARHPLLQAARHLAERDLAAAQARLDAASGPAGSSDAFLLAAAVARASGRPEEARRAQDRAWEAAGLRPVRFDPAARGIAALHCDPVPSAAGPTISVVMPVRDVADHLPAALASLLFQDHRELEVIVVDDGSIDGTVAAAERIAGQDSRVRVLRHATSGGAYAARNRGLAEARGDYVTFHDGDDWSHPQKLSLQLAALLRQPRAVACVSDWVRMTDHGVFCARQVFPLQRMNTSSLLVRRDAMRRAGLFDSVRAGADGEFQARLELLFGPGSVLRLRRLLSVGLVRGDSLTHDTATGYSSADGRLQRLTYWEAWNRWHARVWGERDHAQLRLDGTSRPFPVPPALLAGTPGASASGNALSA